MARSAALAQRPDLNTVARDKGKAMGKGWYHCREWPPLTQTRNTAIDPSQSFAAAHWGV